MRNHFSNITSGGGGLILCNNGNEDKILDVHPSSTILFLMRSFKLSIRLSSKDALRFSR